MSRKPTSFLLLAGFCASLCMLLPSPLAAQKAAFKFEKITAADFVRPAGCDSSAEAVVIADIGETRFDYGPKGFYLIFERKMRILVLKPAGTEYATLSIPLYKNDNNREKVASFKGATFNLVNGEVVKTKVRSEDIFLEDESAHWFHQKVAMPAVKPGSIIEYDYAVNSDFIFNLQPWTFQNMIPVMVSEYSVTVPEYFQYKTLSTGYLAFTVNETLSAKAHFEVHVEPKLGVGTNAVAREPARTEVYDPLATLYHWVARDLPAFRQEPFMTSPKDFMLGIEFELSTLKFPGEGVQNILGDWEKITDKLLEDEDFGKVARRGGFISDQLPGILSGASGSSGKARAIYDAVRQHMKWNGEYGIYANNNPRKSWDTRTGSVGDINLMLVAILNEAGITADPVILSTRSHGRVVEIYPILSKFNYVVARVAIDTVSILLDATSRIIPFNTLPERCLNGNGRIISKDRPGWTRLTSTETKKEFLTADLKLEPDGSLTGSCTINSGGIYGNDRRNIYNNGNEKDLLKEFSDARKGWNASALKVASLDTVDKPFVETYTISMPSGVQVAGDKMYFAGMLELGQSTNPFSREKREFPVDFSCPVAEYAFLTITIPDGWTVEELPKQAIVTLPEKAGTFRFRIQQAGNTLQVTSNMSVNKCIFLPEEYEHLKEFFRLMVAKHAEQVVLKKG